MSDQHLIGSEQADVLNGAEGNDWLEGLAGNDTLIGNEGNDLLDGGVGHDAMYGGAGDDTYYFDFGSDAAIEAAGEGIDTVISSIGIDLSDNVENLVVVADVAGYGGGNALDNVITGSGVGDFLVGYAGNDTLYGGAGYDWLRGYDGDDFLYGEADTDDLFGFTGNDYLDGGEGNDRLDGGSGQDTMVGGVGDDLYVVDDEGDWLIENSGEGVDSVESSVSYQLADHIENLTLVGAAAGATGNDSDNVITGTDGDNGIYGRGGNDVLIGGGGNDYIADYGDGGNDRLIGGTGSDWLIGAGGDDVYEPGFGGQDSVYDSAGTDELRMGPGIAPDQVERIRESFSSHLILRVAGTTESVTLYNWFSDPAFQIERVVFDDGTVWDPATTASLRYLGTAGNDFLHGSWHDESIAGRDGDDVIDGHEGADSLAGGAGNDVYVRSDPFGVDTISDVADASGANQVSFSLLFSADVRLGYEGDFLAVSTTWGEDLLRLTGFDRQDVFGGARAVQNFSFSDGTTLGYEQLLERGFDLFGGNDPAGETLEGTSIQDRMHGLGGGDLLVGYGGDDALYGGDGQDTLHGDSGGADVGNDYLDGGAGNDSLFGWRGSDTYYFDRASGIDTVLELQADAGDIDTLRFGAGITPDDLLVTQDELGNLHIAISGSTAALRFNAWFNPQIPSHVERFEFQDGTVLSDAVVEAMVNDAPVVASPLVDPSAAEDAAFSFNVPANTFADPDPYDSLEYTASLADGSALPSWLSFDSATRTFSGTPANGDVGTISVRLTATDETGFSASDVFALSVTNTNDAPTLAASIADQNATEDTAFTFTVAAGTFADVDAGDALSFSAVQADGGGLPSWLTFDAASRTFSGTPANTDVGTISVRVTATDGAGARASDVFDIAVANTNDAPILATPIADQNATEDSAFSFTFATDAFADVDVGDFLDYAATLASGSTLPSWLLFDPGTRTFSGTPANGDVGTIAVRVIATDAAGASASDVFDIAVANTNDAPVVASPIADQSAQDTIAFSFTVPAGTFAEVDAGDTLSYSATLAGGGALPAWLAFDPASHTFSGTPGVADMGTLSITVTVTDGAGAQASDVFALAVGAAPDQTITGTAGNDTLVGASGNDTIDGLGGADSMSGGLGNDLYYVNQSGDVVIEDAAAGVDTVRSSTTYTLAANVENLELTGTAAINGTGNALDNILSGNAANNRLSGGAGNDTYIITQSGDTVDENSGGGVDAVHASISYSLGNHVENLVLTGNGNINGTGNSLANWLTGNSGSNTLKGGGGADSLSGGAGNDTLTGGSGSDAFYFLEAPGAGNADHITDFAAGERLYLEDLVHPDIGAAGIFAPNDARFFAAAGASSGADASDRVVYDTASGKLYYDADGSGAGAPTLVAILDNVFALSATDIAVS